MEKTGNYFAGVVFLLLVFSVCLFFLFLMSSIEIDSDEMVNIAVPDTISVVDTIPRIGDGYTELLRSNYLLNVAEQTVSVPVYDSVSEDGLVGGFAGTFANVTAEQYTCMDVIVKAGINAGEIQIVADSVVFNPDLTIAEMIVVLPAPQVNTSYIDYSTATFHFSEGHVTGTAENTLSFIEKVVDTIHSTGVQEAINNGLLEEARTASARRVTEFLESLGVEKVRVVFRDSENYPAITSNTR